jgi:hypothetical protein
MPTHGAGEARRFSFLKSMISRKSAIGTDGRLPLPLVYGARHNRSLTVWASEKDSMGRLKKIEGGVRLGTRLLILSTGGAFATSPQLTSQA